MVADASTRVLYVEDNIANFTLVQRLLEASNRFSVERAESAEDARETLERGPAPGLILLDHELPGMLGIEFAREIKSQPKLARVPLILITASVMKQERAQAMDAGVDRFIEKPFDIVMLRNLVEELTVSSE